MRFQVSESMFSIYLERSFDLGVAKLVIVSVIY